MSTLQAPQVKVNSLTMALNFSVSTVFGVLFRITHERALPANYLNDMRKVIEDGLYAWLAEQTLLAVVLEVSLDTETTALERFGIAIAYSADPNMEVRQPPNEDITRLCRTLKALPPNAKYQVLVELAPNATEVPGWVATTAKEINVTQTEQVDDWGFGNIGLTMVYQGSEWGGVVDRNGDSREKVART